MTWAPDYITSSQLKAYDNVSGSADDAQIAWAITTASRAVDGTCSQGHERQFGLVAAVEERRYTPTWSPRRGCWIVDVDDFQTVTGLLVNLDLDEDGTFSDAVTGFTKLPLNAAAKSRPWEQLVLPDTYNSNLCGAEGEVAVTARWGWTTVPVSVEQATGLQASRLLARRHAPFGVAGSPEFGSEVRLLAKVDPDVAVALKTYVRRKLRVG
jgi:hypothetical protein